MGAIDLTWGDIVLGGSALLLAVVIGWLGTRRITEEQFLVGGRSVPWWQLGPTIAAGVMGGGVLLVFSQYAYEYGLSALCILAGLAVGLFLFIPVAVRYKALADQQGFYSLPDLFRQLWGRGVGTLAAVTVLIWTMGFIVIQLVAGGLLLRATANVPYHWGIIAVSVFVYAYLFFGGFRSVILTDCFQYIALGGLLVVVLPVSCAKIDWPTSLQHSSLLDPGTAVGFFLLGALNVLVSADLWQRMYAAKSPLHAKAGIALGGALLLLGGALLMLPALAAAGGGLENIEDMQLALPAALVEYSPRWILGAAIAAILMSVMSTLDTMVFVLGLSVSHDLLVRTLGKSVQFRRRAIRMSMTAALVIGAILAMMYQELLTIGICVTSFGLILAPALLFRRGDRRLSGPAVLGGLLLGLTSVLALLLGEIVYGEGRVLNPQNSLVVLGASIIGTGIGGLVNRCRPR